jgi:methionine aminopeptidase
LDEFFYSTLATSVELAQRATEDMDQLTRAVRQAITEARENLALAATATQLRDFIEQFVGPMILKADGTVTRKETSPPGSPRGDVTRSIAGASYKDQEIPEIWQNVPKIDGTFVTF